ncbi:MAG: hypothetical protein DME92_10280 [Verrucomicrobia bacterium]|nr:MAG: hypothetical protein DME92_10280 [Verrucomicrobiota bacterium]
MGTAQVKAPNLSVKTLRFLLPADALPAEDDAPLKTGSGRAVDLFACANQLVTEPLLTCRLANSDPSRFQIVTNEPETTLESVLLRPDAKDGGAVVIDESSEFAWWSSDGIDEQLREALRDNLPISASAVAGALADEITRLRRFQVSEQFRAQEDAAVIPIFRWSQDSREISGAFIGFWLRPTSGLGIDDERLQTCRIVITSAPVAATVARAGTEGVGSLEQESTAKQQASALHNLRGAKQRKVQAPQQEPAKIYQDVLDRATTQNIHVVVSISKQRVYLMVSNEVAIDSPISSGRPGKSTPTGSFTVSEKDKNHMSSIYHCPMKYFLRLSGMSLGLHVGQLPGYPASHGCVRLPEEVAKLLFEKAPVGTGVTIEA